MRLSHSRSNVKLALVNVVIRSGLVVAALLQRPSVPAVVGWGYSQLDAAPVAHAPRLLHTARPAVSL